VDDSAILGIEVETTIADGAVVYGASAAGNTGGPSGR
jgi:hypothetical protein